MYTFTHGHVIKRENNFSYTDGQDKYSSIINIIINIKNIVSILSVITWLSTCEWRGTYSPSPFWYRATARYNVYTVCVHSSPGLNSGLTIPL